LKQSVRHLSPERREKILAAARELFLRNGLRGTSMEAIAREAGVAKPTLYAYFADKDVVFSSLAGQVFDEWQVLVSRELSGPGSAADRIGRALTEKLKAYFRLVRTSPHAADFYGENSRLLAAQIDGFERWLEEEIVGVLVADGQHEARKHAQVLLACAAGLAAKAKFVEEIGPATRLVVSKLLA
jgi:AcrR family transcriptional regulator